MPVTGQARRWLWGPVRTSQCFRFSLNCGPLIRLFSLDPFVRLIRAAKFCRRRSARAFPPCSGRLLPPPPGTPYPLWLVVLLSCSAVSLGGLGKFRKRKDGTELSFGDEQTGQILETAATHPPWVPLTYLRSEGRDPGSLNVGGVKLHTPHLG